MITTLLITIVVESTVVIGYCRWRAKPQVPILLTSITGNVITQSLLWVALNLFFHHYLPTLLIAEGMIWIVESLLLYAIPASRLYIADALFLSLGMNLTSFAVGWFLSV